VSDPTQQKYKVIRKFDAGGMAEVFIADAIGAGGIIKRVAIKRILPSLAENKKFVAMFLDEARVATLLSHANIVQTFDVGESDDSYFIVMEFVDGASLKGIVDYRAERGQLIPMGAAVKFVIEACKGLDYAHNAVDYRQKPLNIVHRDISPPNLLISVRGEVKVVDFGLAKAASQLEETDPGVVKGKFSYLCPEAVQGLTVDHRADIFSLGIILWELLTGKRLFYGQNEYKTVQLVEKCHIPSISVLNPHVPQVLDDIVYKALIKDRDLRYQHAADFADALTSFLFSAGLKATSQDIAALVREFQGQGTARSDGEANLADLLVEEELLAGFTIDDQAAATNALPEQTGEAIDTRGWVDDLGFDPPAPESESESGPESESVKQEITAPAAPPAYGAGPAEPPSAVKGQKTGLLKRLFGGGSSKEDKE
jgi:eukaryotic-like serine/threonine-protein kinase